MGKIKDLKHEKNSGSVQGYYIFFSSGLLYFLQFRVIILPVVIFSLSFQEPRVFTDAGEKLWGHLKSFIEIRPLDDYLLFEEFPISSSSNP